MQSIITRRQATRQLFTAASSPLKTTAASVGTFGLQPVATRKSTGKSFANNINASATADSQPTLKVAAAPILKVKTDIQIGAEERLNRIDPVPVQNTDRTVAIGFDSGTGIQTIQRRDSTLRNPRNLPVITTCKPLADGGQFCATHIAGEFFAIQECTSLKGKATTCVDFDSRPNPKPNVETPVTERERLQDPLPEVFVPPAKGPEDIIDPDAFLPPPVTAVEGAGLLPLLLVGLVLYLIVKD